MHWRQFEITWAENPECSGRQVGDKHEITQSRALREYTGTSVHARPSAKSCKAAENLVCSGDEWSQVGGKCEIMRTRALEHPDVGDKPEIMRSENLKCPGYGWGASAKSRGKSQETSVKSCEVRHSEHPERTWETSGEQSGRQGKQARLKSRGPSMHPFQRSKLTGKPAWGKAVLRGVVGGVFWCVAWRGAWYAVVCGAL